LGTYINKSWSDGMLEEGQEERRHSAAATSPNLSPTAVSKDDQLKSSTDLLLDFKIYKVKHDLEGLVGLVCCFIDVVLLSVYLLMNGCSQGRMVFHFFFSLSFVKWLAGSEREQPEVLSHFSLYLLACTTQPASAQASKLLEGVADSLEGVFIGGCIHWRVYSLEGVAHSL